MRCNILATQMGGGDGPRVPASCPSARASGGAPGPREPWRLPPGISACPWALATVSLKLGSTSTSPHPHSPFPVPLLPRSHPTRVLGALGSRPTVSKLILCPAPETPFPCSAPTSASLPLSPLQAQPGPRVLTLGSQIARSEPARDFPHARLVPPVTGVSAMETGLSEDKRLLRPCPHCPPLCLDLRCHRCAEWTQASIWRHHRPGQPHLGMPWTSLCPPGSARPLPCSLRPPPGHFPALLLPLEKTCLQCQPWAYLSPHLPRAQSILA